MQVGRIFNKAYYSISAAVHNKVVRARPKNERKIRENPKQRMKNEKYNKKGNQQGGRFGKK